MRYTIEVTSHNNVHPLIDALEWLWSQQSEAEHAIRDKEKAFWLPTGLYELYRDISYNSKHPLIRLFRYRNIAVEDTLKGNNIVMLTRVDEWKNML